MKVRKCGGEKHFFQGKEQRLSFAGAVVKRYPMPQVRETQVRWYVLQEGIKGQTHCPLIHTYRKTTQFNHTRTTALSNSRNLSHACRATQDGQRGLIECGPLEKGMANHFSILPLRTP